MAQLDRAIAYGEFDLGYFVIAPDTREVELLKACPEAEPSVLNGPHRSFRLPMSTIAQCEFIPFVYFSNDKISKLKLFRDKAVSSTGRSIPRLANRPNNGKTLYGSRAIWESGLRTPSRGEMFVPCSMKGHLLPI